MKTWYQMTAEEALRGMESSHGGLSSGQAEVRCGQFGENVLQEHAGKKIWQVFLEQFQDLLVLILIVAAAISVLSGSGESAAVIFAVITMNAVLGTIQHEKARKSLESLKKLSAPVAQVLRDGKSQEIPAAKVVPGDIVLLDAGSLVAADGRLLECYNLQVNESSLTGESLPVEKRAGVEDVAGIPLGDQYNMVFAGSLVTGGRGVFVVTATGMETELGKIARLMNMAKEKKTPLQVSLDQFSTHLAALILGICVLVFGLSLYRGTSVLESLMFAVALAVAAIPEALGSIVTIVQAMGTQQMAKEHAIIKDLKAVESLGAVSVICSDKTGTLTQNKMTPQKVYADGSLLEGVWLDYSFVASQSDDCIVVPMQSVKYVSDENGETASVVFIKADSKPENTVAIDIPPTEPGATPLYPSESEGFYPVPVTTGLSDNYNVEIKEGLTGDEEVFVNYYVEQAWG